MADGVERFFGRWNAAHQEPHAKGAKPNPSFFRVGAPVACEAVPGLGAGRSLRWSPRPSPSRSPFFDVVENDPRRRRVHEAHARQAQLPARLSEARARARRASKV